MFISVYMSAESLLKELISKVSALDQKLSFLCSEKSLNEDPDYVKAMSEAKKGNVKPLQEYGKRRVKIHN